MKVNLCLFRKDGSTKVIPMPSSVSTIGRRTDCDLCIPLPAVSRKHCELNTDQGRLTVRDLGSQNGTFVNGSRVEEARINPGDELQIANVCFRIQIDGVPENPAGLQPHPVKQAPSVPADVRPTNSEDAFEDMLKGMSGLDLDQTLNTEISQEVDQQS